MYTQYSTLELKGNKESVLECVYLLRLLQLLRAGKKENPFFVVAPPPAPPMLCAAIVKEQDSDRPCYVTPFGKRGGRERRLTLLS